VDFIFYNIIFVYCMSLEAQRIKMSNMEIYNSGSDLLFDATQNISFNTGSGNIFAPNETINLDDNTIINCLNVTGQSGIDITIESRGTGDILIKVPDTVTTPNLRISNNGISYFNSIPTCNVSATTTNDILRWNNFTTQTAFTPVLTSDAATGSATYSSRGGVFTRIGNLVFFRAGMVITATTGLPSSSEARFSIPVPIDYTSLAMPQALQFSSFVNLDVTSCDYTCSIGGSGNVAPGTTIDFCKIYLRDDQTAANQTAVRITDLVQTGSTTIRYSGVYYVF
jgi:hypothetical protein